MSDVGQGHVSYDLSKLYVTSLVCFPPLVSIVTGPLELHNQLDFCSVYIFHQSHDKDKGSQSKCSFCANFLQVLNHQLSFFELNSVESTEFIEFVEDYF